MVCAAAKGEAGARGLVEPAAQLIALTAKCESVTPSIDLQPETQAPCGRLATLVGGVLRQSTSNFVPTACKPADQRRKVANEGRMWFKVSTAGGDHEAGSRFGGATNVLPPLAYRLRAEGLRKERVPWLGRGIQAFDAQLVTLRENTNGRQGDAQGARPLRAGAEAII